MIQVTRDEIIKLRERFPDIKATRTVNKWYVPEESKYMHYLKNGCGMKVIEHYDSCAKRKKG